MIAGRILQLTKDSFVYGLGSALTSFIGIFLVPILTRIFTPEEYGALDLLVTIVFLANVILAFGFDSASGILFFEKDDEERRVRILSTSALFVFLVSSVLVVILLPFRDPLSRMLFGSTAFSPAIGFTLATVPFLQLLGFGVASLRYRFARGRYLVGVLVNVLLTIGMTVLFVVGLRKGVTGYFLAWWLTAMFSAVVVLFLARRNFRVMLSGHRLRQLLAIGLPLVPAGLAGWSLSLIDRFFLNTYSLESLGWYSLGVKLASILGLGVAALQLAWGPFALSLAHQPDAQRTYAKTLTLYTAGAGVLALLVTAFAPEIISFTSAPAFAPAAQVVGVLTLGLVAYGAYSIAAIGVSIAKKTIHITWTTLSAAMINIILNFILIPPFGMVGAALATLISYLASLFLIYRVSQRFYPIPYEVGKLVRTWLLLGGAVGILAFIPHTVSPLFIVVKVFVIVAFLFLLVGFGILERGELSAVKNLVRGTLSAVRHRA